MIIVLLHSYGSHMSRRVYGPASIGHVFLRTTGQYMSREGGCVALRETVTIQESHGETAMNDNFPAHDDL